MISSVSLYLNRTHESKISENNFLSLNFERIANTNTQNTHAHTQNIYNLIKNV